MPGFDYDGARYTGDTQKKGAKKWLAQTSIVSDCLSVSLYRCVCVRVLGQPNVYIGIWYRVQTRTHNDLILVSKVETNWT